MKLTFLGTGTSHGVPMLGCSCPVCLSEDIRDKRWRSSILLESSTTTVVIDTGYEFRLQGLRVGLKRLDGVLYTHAHADHIMGLDDLRVFSKDGVRLPVYGSRETLEEIRSKVPYAFIDRPNWGLPQLDERIVEPYEEFSVGDIGFIPIPVMHGCSRIFGYRFGRTAYITDVSDILYEENREYLANLDTLIIGALREKPHPTHYTFLEAIEAAKRLKAGRVYFQHMSHDMSHREILERYGNEALPSYDMLSLEV